MENIVKVQSLFRRYILIYAYISSKYQSKTWRKSQHWYDGGKRCECEKYQLKQYNCMTGVNFVKSGGTRINLETLEMKKIRHPLKLNNGFEWTEDFDGYYEIKNNTEFYINLKFVCDNGGAQTRSLREVYHFIKAQIGYLIKNENENNQNIYFINILDGDTSFKHNEKFKYLFKKNKNLILKSNIFVGDMYSFPSNIFTFSIIC